MFSNRYDRKFVVFLSCLCFAYITPIILAGRYYIDDMGRGQWGYYNWASNGRPFADLIMEFLVGGGRIVDASPLFLFIGTVVFIFCCHEYHKANPFIAPSRASPFMSGLVFFYIYANPFMLENISYKFDALPMLLSLSLLLMAFLEYRNVYTKIIPVAIIVASLSLYQASIGFYICLAVIECIKCISVDGRKTVLNVLKKPAVRFVQLVVAYVIYAKLIQPYYLIGDYNVSHSKVIELNLDGFDIFASNCLIFFGKILSVFGVIKYQISFVLCFMVIHLVVVAYGVIRNEGGCNYTAIVYVLIIALSPVIIFTFSFVHLALLERPVFASRTMMSLSGFLFFIAYASHHVLCKWRVGCLFCLVIVSTFFIVSFSYGNALKAQKEFDYNIANSIVSKVHELDHRGLKKVKIFGSQPSSTIRDSVISKYGFMSDLIPLYMVNGWGWGGSILSLVGLKNGFELGVSLDDVCNARISYMRREFFIREVGDYLIVDFAMPACKN